MYKKVYDNYSSMVIFYINLTRYFELNAHLIDRCSENRSRDSCMTE